MESKIEGRSSVGRLSFSGGKSTVGQSNEFMMPENMDGLHKLAVHLKTNGSNSPDLIVDVIADCEP